MNSNHVAGHGSDDFQKTVSEKLMELKRESQNLGKEIEELQNRLAKNAQMITHLEGILDLSSDAQKAGAPPVLRRANYMEVCDLVEQILSERQKNPVHYRELADEVQRRGIELGGAKPGRTLVAIISKDPRFVRPVSRGFYALRKDYPDARNVGEHKRRGRKQETGQ